MILGRKSQCLFYNAFVRDPVIQYILPATEARKGSPLGAVLTRYALEAESIYSSFNLQTSTWSPGVLVPLTIISTAPKKFALNIKSPSIYTIINFVWPFDLKTTRVLQLDKRALIGSLFKAALIKASDSIFDQGIKVRNYFFNKRIKNYVSQAVGTFRSFRVYSLLRRKTKRIYKKRK